jgi:hypothetical protein
MQKLAVHACTCVHDGGEKRNVLIVSVLLQTQQLLLMQQYVDNQRIVVVDVVTREEPGTLTQGGALFSLVPLVWESNPKLQGCWCKTQPPAHRGI